MRLFAATCAAHWQVKNNQYYYLRLNTYPHCSIAYFALLLYIHGYKLNMAATTRYALVLSGGAFKGAFQTGAINYLKDHWTSLTGQASMHFDIIAGVSTGALNGCFVAMNKLYELNMLWDAIAEKGVEEIYTSAFTNTQNENGPRLHLNMEALRQQLAADFNMNLTAAKALSFLSVKNRKVFIKENTKALAENITAHLHRFKALTNNEPLHNKLRQLVNLAHIPAGTRYSAGFASLQSGHFYNTLHTDFDDNNEFINALLASASIPLVWPPVQSIRTRQQTIYQAVDGGAGNCNPIGNVIHLINSGPEPNAEYRMIIINCNTAEADEAPDAARYNIAQTALRATHEMAAAKVFRTDMERFFTTNGLVLQSAGQSLYQYNYNTQQRNPQPLRVFPFMLIEPAPGELGPSFVAGKTLTDQRIKHGWNRAAEVLAKGKDCFNYTPL
jgi:NTE family protein